MFHNVLWYRDSDGEPSCKVRKTSNVLVNQPSDDKVVMDSVPDNTLNLDQVVESYCWYLSNNNNVVGG